MTQTQNSTNEGYRSFDFDKRENFWHYSILPFLLIIPILTTIDVFKYYITHTYVSKQPIDLTFGYIWILPALIFYFIQKSRLKFKTINISVDNTIFHHLVEQATKELEWDIQKMTHDIVIAKSGFSGRSLGKQKTILHDKDKILFNSICDPDNKPSVASLGMNKLNRRSFEQLLVQNAPSKSIN